jgi:glycosyltransferase involved in cell wall biosynthesis
MKLGVLTRDEPVYSLCVYRDNLIRELKELDVNIIPIQTEYPELDSVDIIWDPGLISARFPLLEFRDAKIPIVVTIHGLAGHTLSIREYFPDPIEAVVGQVFHEQVSEEWKWFRKKVTRVIAVSEYGADEIVTIYQVPRKKVTAIYHGLDHDIFKEGGAVTQMNSPYLLQIAQYAPKKNIDRVLEAYAQLPDNIRPEFYVIIPNYEGLDPDIKGVNIIREVQTHEELAAWYRGALGFVFPSIHETFGLPALEAMACGCPVITSDATAMPEMTDDAALLVNPRSIDEITDAIQRLVEDAKLRESLREKGLTRARQFTWEKSAGEHLEVFQSAL